MGKSFFEMSELKNRTAMDAMRDEKFTKPRQSFRRSQGGMAIS